MSNAFNKFFVQPIFPSDHEKLRTFCNNRIPQDINFNIPLLEAHKVEACLKSIDTTKATGTDNIGPRILKIAATEIADSVTFICNCSIKIIIS